LWWIFPEDGKNHDRSERKFKIERRCSVEKPDKLSLGSAAYKIRFKEYKNALKKESAEWQAESVANFDRPPKRRLRKATAILLPLVEYDIEPYRPTDFEKNLRGKVMLTEKGSIIGVGRVDRVINFSSHYFIPPTNQGKMRSHCLLNIDYVSANDIKCIDYKNQYGKVVSSASSLFKLPTEQKQLELFLDHVTNNEHAKNSIQQMKQLSFWKQWE
jgi:hypothetical protein